MLSRRALGALAALAATAPPPAQAAAPATSVVSGNVAGPSSTFTEVTAAADCAGRPLSGGGTRLAQTTQTVEHNGIHVDGSFPSPDGPAQAADGTLSPSRWVAAGGAGGGVPSDAQTLAYGVCLDAGPAATRIVVASATGPAATYQAVRATATCPDGTRLLSGGARTTPGTVGSLKPNGSFPSDPAGTPVLSGGDPSSWTVSGLNGGGGDQGNTTYAFAVCATGGSPVTVTVVHGQVPGPAPASTPVQTTVTCPSGTALLGGGGFVSDAFGLPGSQGDHLTGSFPSDAAGTPVAGGPAASWTVASHTGGVDSGGLTQTDAWAMCASPADAPPPPASGPSVPANAAAPAISGTPAVGRTLAEVHGRWLNQPTTYAYRWLRCGATASTCAAIPGATGPSYRPAAADIGARLRVQETAGNPTGKSAPAASAATAPVAGGRVTAAQVEAQLARQIAPRGPATRIASTLVRGETILPFTALEAGRAVVGWYLVSGRRAVLVARGTRGFPGARAATITVRLTAAGRRALTGARRVRLTARGTFAPTGRAVLRATRTFVLTR